MLYDLLQFICPDAVIRVVEIHEGLLYEGPAAKCPEVKYDLMVAEPPRTIPATRHNGWVMSLEITVEKI